MCACSLLILIAFFKKNIVTKGKWCEKTYKNTLTEYKIILKDWFKGTGGGSGASTMFEDWSSEKLNSYDVDPAVYDHSDVKMRPSILIDNYAKKKEISDYDLLMGRNERVYFSIEV